MIHPQFIEAILDRIAAGELSAEQASELLLSTAQSADQRHPPTTTRIDAASQNAPHLRSTPATAGTPASPVEHEFHEPNDGVEPLRELVQRLGPPPLAVIEHWRRMLQNYEIGTGIKGNFEKWELSHWGVARDGSLVSLATTSEPHDFAQVKGQSERKSRKNNNGLDSLANDQTPTRITSTSTNLSESHASEPKTTQRQQRNQRLLWVSLIGCATLVIGAIGYAQFQRASTPKLASIDPRQEKLSSAPEMAENPSSPVPSTRPNRTASSTVNRTTEPLSLETFDNKNSDAEAPSQVVSTSLDTSIVSEFRVLDLLPSGINTAASPASESNKDPQKDAQPLDHINQPTGDAAPMASLKDIADDNSEAPADAPQATHAASVDSVTLPDPQAVNASIPIPLALSNIELLFPMNSTLTLARNEPNRVTIIDSKSQNPLATLITGVVPQSSEFRWTPTAGDVSASTQLVHGRFRQSASERSVFLRPTIQAEPYSLTFERSDDQPTWDLLYPVPAEAKLSLNLSLPEEVEYGWIQPYDESSPRRGRAIAVMTLKDNESVSVGLLMDVKSGKRLSIRLRTSARIDSSLPWQSFSRGSLRTGIDTVARAVQQAQQQFARVQATYDQADTTERRQLRDTRDAVKQQHETLKGWLQRMGELEKLTDYVAEFGHLDVSLTVPWPDQTQVIFQTIASDE